MAKSQLAVPGMSRGRGQHGVDGRVGVVEGDGVDAVEARQVVLVRRVVAVPGDHVERRVIDERGPQAAEKLGGDVELAVAVFIGGHGRLEVARIGEAVGADGAELGQAERQAVVFADVAAGLLLLKHDAEFDAARDHADLAGRDVEDAEFGVEAQRAELGNDEQLAVGGVEEAVVHRGVAGVEVDRDAGLHRGIAVAAQRDDAVDEVGWLRGNGQRIPAQLIGRGRRLRGTGRCESGVAANLFVRAMRDRRPDAVGPGAAVGGARRGEGRAAELLGVEAERMLLRRVLPHAASAPGTASVANSLPNPD